MLNETDLGIDQLPIEYLQSLNPASLPPSQLLLKVGAPVITKLGVRCIEATILNGVFVGVAKLLPRIKLDVQFRGQFRG